MEILRRITKPIVHVVLLGFLSLTLHVPVAHAGMVRTETVVSAQQAQATRDRIRATLNREDIRGALLARGVRLDQVQARVNSLSDEEAQQLVNKIDQLPAGGDVLDALVLIFIILLVTDLMGLTDVFPFVKKPARH
jgi:hypothetical protein